MKFGDFLFPESKTPDTDYQVVMEALKEAELADELGFDSIWMGEHHFDGACSYADPMTFAGAVVARTKRAKIGFSAVQTALHHPVRLAEQVALLDNLSDGRIILGTARGTAFNFYEYRGYGVSADDGAAMLRETEEILVNAWTSDGYKHKGQFWDVEIPVLRPKVFQSPHPPIIRAIASENSLVDMAKQGRPVMMVVQPKDEAVRRVDLYKKTMAEAGYDDERIASNMDNFYMWLNVVVAETDAEAEKIGGPAYLSSREHIETTRRKFNTGGEQSTVAAPLSDSRFELENALVFGSPATVCEKIEDFQKMGMGGLIIHFRVGPLSYEDNAESLRLFAEQVAPEFRAKVSG